MIELGFALIGISKLGDIASNTRKEVASSN
jgi:hypothetical protein